MNFDPEAQAAVDLAKRAVAKGAALDLPTLLAAVYHSTPLKERYPQLAKCLTAPGERRGRTPGGSGRRRVIAAGPRRTGR